MTNVNPHPQAIDNTFLLLHDGRRSRNHSGHCAAQQPDKPLPCLGEVTTCCNGYLWTTRPEEVQGIARTITDVATALATVGLNQTTH